MDPAPRFGVHQLQSGRWVGFNAYGRGYFDYATREEAVVSTWAFHNAEIASFRKVKRKDRGRPLAQRYNALRHQLKRKGRPGWRG